MKSEFNNFLVVVVGATAVGKTEMSIRIARYFQTEIVSADSRQFFREMNIGTAKPKPKELALVKHYLINSHSIQQNYTVGMFEKEALKALENIFSAHQTAVLAGGSGLYIKVICEGMDKMPEANPEIRKKLIEKMEKEGLAVLLKDLEKLDKDYFDLVDKSNPQRIIRALEICLSSGKSYSFFRKQKKAQRPFKIIKIGLQRPRSELYERIEKRMDEMIEDGLLEEAKSLLPYRSNNALQTVGYQEIFDFLDGNIGWLETLRLLKRNSRRFAKRQLTWFHKDKEIQWFNAEDIVQIIAFIEKAMRNA